MPFKVYVGDSNLQTHEIEHMDTIRELLQRAYDQSDRESCHLAIGLELGSCEIDGLAVKKNGIIILELKDLEGEIEACWEETDEDGHLKWSVKAPGRDVYHPEDPLLQVRKQRVEIARLLRKKLGLDRNRAISNPLPFVSGCIVVKEESNIDIRGLPHNYARWLSVTRPSEAVRKIMYKSRAFRWDETDVDEFIRLLGAEAVDPENWMIGQRPHSLRAVVEGEKSEELLLPTLSVFLETADSIEMSQTDNPARLVREVLRHLLHLPKLEGARLDYLDQLFGSESPGEVAKAIQRAQVLRLKQYLPEVIGHAGHKDAMIRAAVVDAVRDMQPGRATSVLVQYVRDQSPSVRMKALEALLAVGNSSATPALIRVLRSGEEDDVLLAIRTLGEIGDDRAVEPLVRLNSEYTSRFTESKIMGPPTRSIILALGSIASPKASRFIIENLSVKGDVTKSYAIEALGIIGCAESKDALLRLLREDADSCPDSIRALGLVGDADIAPHLHPFLRSGQKELYPTVAHALARIGSPESFDPLWEVYGEELSTSSRERDSASHSLLYSIGDALCRIDKSRMETHLIPFLEHENTGIRRRAVLALSEIASERSIEPLMSLLGDSDDAIWSTASYVVARVGGKSILSKVVPLLKSTNEFERASAVAIVAEVDGKESTELILPMRYDKSIAVRTMVALAVGQTESDVQDEILKEMVEDPAQDVREMATIMMEKLSRRKSE